uniref:Uncharacterized protein n=1 Tax=Arundo donax TaxID=35708 RepID=A0A0A8YZ88_ARUDO
MMKSTSIIYKFLSLSIRNNIFL